MLLFFYALLLAACHPKMVPHASTGNTNSAANNDGAALTSPINKEITDEKGNPQLLGICTRSALQQPPYNTWFIKNYNDYTVDSATANRLRISLAGRQLTIFMGTWCGDSRREVPRIYKILDYCGIDSSAVRLVMVSAADSAYKQSPGHEERGLDIFRVPDLIVRDRDTELGRIVESPVISLEKDLLLLSAKEGYTPQYPGANRLMHLFREEQPANIEEELPQVAARIRPLVHSPSELNGYARVMRTAGEQQKASIILKINALIFPQ
jgi:hypothetical protein